MPKLPTRLKYFIFVLVTASLACTFPPLSPTPTPAEQLPSTPPPQPPVLQTYTPTLTETPTATLTPTFTATSTVSPLLPPTQQNLLGCTGYQDSYSCAQAGCLWSRPDGLCRNKTKACAQNKTQGSCQNAGCSWNFKFKSCY
jgi:hypothetical protein